MRVREAMAMQTKAHPIRFLIKRVWGGLQHVERISGKAVVLRTWQDPNTRVPVGRQVGRRSRSRVRQIDCRGFADRQNVTTSQRPSLDSAQRASQVRR